MAAAPSNIALYSDFAGAAGSTFPVGWQEGLYSGEVGWKLSGSGTLIPTVNNWAAAATMNGFTRGATSGGVVIEYSTLPINNANANFVYLVNDKTLDSIDGYGIRWNRGTADFQLQKFVNGTPTYQDGSGESALSGTIAAGFKLALMADSSGVTAYASTDGGSTWQQIATSADTTGNGAMFYGGVESNDSGTTPNITNFWLGLNGSGSGTIPPQMLAGTLAAPTSGNTVTPVLPPHQAGDILLVCASHSAAATLACATSGWATVVASQSSANYSTGWFWKRATSSAETNPTISGYATYSTTLGNYATAFVIRGCVASGTPWENAAANGTPTSSTTPQSTATATTAPNRLVACFAQMDDNLTITNHPPALWSKIANSQNTANGGDHTILGIQRNLEASGTAAQVNTNTQSAAAYWRTLSLAFIPAAVTPSSRLKRWDGSAWVVANFKVYSGGSWVVKPWKKLP